MFRCNRRRDCSLPGIRPTVCRTMEAGRARVPALPVPVLLLLILLVRSMLPRPAVGAEAYEDVVPVELARLLLDFSNSGQFAIYDGVMDSFPAVDLPDAFSVAGSLAMDNMQRVALATELDPDAAQQQVVAAYEEAGWLLLPSFEPFANRDRGFVSSNGRGRGRIGNNLCHEELGNVSVSSRLRNGQTSVMLTASAQQVFSGRRQSCAQQLADQQQMLEMQSARGNSRGQNLPRMELPEVESRPGWVPVQIGGLSSSGGNVETEASIEVDWDIDALYRHLRTQIDAQGWSLDSESVGELSATGTWSREVEDASGGAGGNLIGTLNIVSDGNVVSDGDNRYQLRFNLVTPGGSSSYSPFRVLRSGN